MALKIKKYVQHNVKPILVDFAVVNPLKSNRRQSSADRDAQNMGSFFASRRAVNNESTFCPDVVCRYFKAFSSLIVPFPASCDIFWVSKAITPINSVEMVSSKRHFEDDEVKFT